MGALIQSEPDMNIVSTPSVLAPQTTGHPLGLPEVGQSRNTSAKVRSLEQLDTALSRSGSDTPRDDAQRQRKANEEAAAAPPTILQMKIDEILRKQAEAIAANMPDAEPDPPPEKEPEPALELVDADAPSGPVRTVDAPMIGVEPVIGSPAERAEALAEPPQTREPMEPA
ncbi:hypothetical protein ACS3SW_18950 [Roseobacteraceae bacterium S113]